MIALGPEEIKAVVSRGNVAEIFAILTTQTCGEACWMAREEVCRCSCGGKNHGCLSHGRQRPERHSKIDGIAYKLAGVGPRGSLYAEAERINKEAGYRYIDRPTYIIDGMGASYTEAQWLEAKTQGRDCWVSQYYGVWSETDSGAPARIKFPSVSQKKWIEFAAFAGDREAALLWVRLEMPERPDRLKVDRDGKPLENQNP